MVCDILLDVCESNQIQSRVVSVVFPRLSPVGFLLSSLVHHNLSFPVSLDVLAPPQATSPSSNGSDMSCWNMTANPVWDQRLYEPTADFSGYRD